MKYICLILIFLVSFSCANEFQKKHLNKQQIKFLKDHPKIIVSNLEDWAPYDYYENGKAKGYSVEYVKLIAKKIGIEVVFDTNKWSDIITKVKNKQIDLVHPLSMNEKRKEYLHYTQSIFKNDMVIVTNDSHLDIKTLSDLKGKTLAVGKGWNTTRILKENYPDINYKDYDGSLSILKAVAYGEADAAIDGFLTVNYLKQKHLLNNLQITGRAKIPGLDQKLYMATRKDWKILADIINITINNITSEELVSLNTKWMQENKKKIIFSKEESTFLKKNKKFSLCIDPDWFPYERIEDGKHIGMSLDYFEEFRKSIPSQIEFKTTKTWSESLNLVKNKECDILALAVQTPSRQSFLNFSKPYLNLPLVIATRLEKPFISKIEDVLQYKLAVRKDHYHVELLKNKYPNINLIEVESLEESFKKVISGEVYGFIDTLTVIGYEIQNNYLGRIKVSGKLEETYEVGVAVRKDMPLLIPIFDKAIENIKEEEHREILNKWVSVKYESKINYTYLWIMLTVLAIISLFFLYRQSILKKQNILLKESIDEFEHLINSTLEAIFILEDGKCIDCNNEGLKLLGFKDKKEIIGIGILDVVTPEYHNLVSQNLKQESAEPYELTFRKKDDTKIPVLARGKNFIRRNKKIRVSGVIDLSQLKNNEKLLIEQSKMVALGEMLENIAHQWRQPLSVISTAASGVKIQKEHGLLNDKIFNDSMDGIIDNANYLSKTIDDFRNFILANKEKTTFNLKNHIENDLSILYSMTKINNIQVISNIDKNINLATIENELTQSIINIINNSKDQFIKENIEDRFIFINAFIKNQKAIISIKDNANGIKDEIINKVFEPYYTTKHKNVGTGLGLYMTRKIISESLEGSISVQNTNYIYEDLRYKGAEFIIELPL